METATLDNGTTLALVRYADGGYGLTRDRQPAPELGRWRTGEIEQCLAEFNRVVARGKSLLAEPEGLVKKRILAVDDEPHITDLIKLYLERFGRYEVQTENTTTEVMRAARDFGPDVIILDVMMPEPDGSELAAFLKEDPLLRDIPIVFLTAMVSQTQSRVGFDQRHYLAKPINFDELIRHIEEATAPALG